MVARADDGVRRGTRKRAGLLAGVALAGLAGMFLGVSQNVLAVNFTTANTSYKVYTDKVSGPQRRGLPQRPGPVRRDRRRRGPARVQDRDAQRPLRDREADAAGDRRRLAGGLRGEPVDGTITNPAGQSINAQQLYLASDNLTGTGDQIAKLTLGQSADTLMMDTLPFAGTPGAFGLQAQTLNVSNLDADSYGIDLQGQINLPNLKIRVLPGVKTKADCLS
jgi:hypothetical protein